jgi:hypothetical protein
MLAHPAALVHQRTHPSRSYLYVVTADRELKMRVLQTKNLNGGAVVDPAKFWND